MDSLLKMEDGGFLLLEDGTRIVLEMETLMASNKISLDNYAIDEIYKVEGFDLETKQMVFARTLTEDASLTLTADNNEITNAKGEPLIIFTRNQRGTLTYNNSLHSVADLAEKFGADVVKATADNTVVVPVAETLVIGADHTATLKYTPIADSIEYALLIQDEDPLGKSLELQTGTSTPSIGHFTVSGTKLTFPSQYEAGSRVLIEYDRESAQAIKTSKGSETMTKVRELHLHAIVRDVCDPNTKYEMVIVAHRAQIDATNVEESFAADSKPSTTWNITKDPCGDNPLVDFIVSFD